jgi:hypothetical protein
MMVRNLDFKGVAILPLKTNTKLVVDPHTVLPFAISLQCLQAVCRNRCQVAKLLRTVDLNQTSKSDGRDILETLDAALVKDRFRVGVVKRPDQTNIVLRFALDERASDVS